MNNITSAVMQPYFYPYIGYFHLIRSVDKFVIFDDVNFIKKGWINRNQILLNGQAHLFSISIKEMSQNKKINESFIHEPKLTKNKIFNLIRNSYIKAPFFKENLEVLEAGIMSSEENIALYNFLNLKGLSSHLGLKTEFLLSSNLPHEKEAKGQEKILSILKCLKVTSYVNAIGGQSLYNKDDFAQVNIELNFVKSSPVEYPQGTNPFVPNLSIIDVLMYAGKARTIEMLDHYKLC